MIEYQTARNDLHPRIAPDIYMMRTALKGGRDAAQIVANVFSNPAISFEDSCAFAKTAATALDDICGSLKSKGASDEAIDSYKKWYATGYSEVFNERLAPVTERNSIG